MPTLRSTASRQPGTTHRMPRHPANGDRPGAASRRSPGRSEDDRGRHIRAPGDPARLRAGRPAPRGDGADRYPIRRTPPSRLRREATLFRRRHEVAADVDLVHRPGRGRHHSPRRRRPRGLAGVALGEQPGHEAFPGATGRTGDQACRRHRRPNPGAGASQAPGGSPPLFAGVIGVAGVHREHGGLLRQLREQVVDRAGTDQP
jgi:hypothetical protein